MNSHWRQQNNNKLSIGPLFNAKYSVDSKLCYTYFIIDFNSYLSVQYIYYNHNLESSLVSSGLIVFLGLHYCMSQQCILCLASTLCLSCWAIVDIFLACYIVLGVSWATSISIQKTFKEFGYFCIFVSWTWRRSILYGTRVHSCCNRAHRTRSTDMSLEKLCIFLKNNLLFHCFLMRRRRNHFWIGFIHVHFQYWISE